MISIAQASEMTAVEEASAFIKAAIENDTPLRLIKSSKCKKKTYLILETRSNLEPVLK